MVKNPESLNLSVKLDINADEALAKLKDDVSDIVNDAFVEAAKLDSVIHAKASVELQAEIDEELKKKDPSLEQAKAIFEDKE